MEEKACCFFGHKSMSVTEELREKLYLEIEDLIINNGVNAFLFCGKGCFDRLCLETVTELKKKYLHLKRIYVRAEYPYLNDWYERSLLKIYDETYYPEKIVGAGKTVYVERNVEMIKRSRYCIVYYSEEEAPKNRKSGTKIAIEYAKRYGIDIICVGDMPCKHGAI